MKEKRRYTSARERADKQSTGFASASLKLPDGASLFKPKAGTMLIDILPYEAGEGNPWAEPGNLHWERTYYTHKGIGANGDTYVCPRMTAKEACPICEARLKLMKEGDTDNESLVKDLAPKQRQLFNVINRKDPDKGVQIWDFSYFLFGKLLDARLRNSEDDDGWDKFFFLEDGLTLKVGFAEESYGGHAFCKTETIDFKSREDYDDDILDDVHCLDEIIEVLPYDKLKKIFLEARDVGGKDKDEDDEQEDKPRKRRDREEDDDEKPSKRRREEVEEEPEEDEPKAKKKAPKDDDDDWGDFEDKKSKKKDEDEPEEREEKEAKRGRKDEEDEEPPRRKRREEPEEEEAPRKRRSRDEEENESEQPEDEPPRRKRKDDDDESDHRSKKQPGLRGSWGDIEDDEPAPKKKRKDDDE